MATVFRSKVDSWLLAVLVLAMVTSVVAAVSLILAGPPWGWWVALLSAGIGVGLPLWPLLTIRYTLDAHQLLVRSGPFTWRIAIAEITAVSPTRDPLSSPALSLQRLRVVYSRGRSLMISPDDPEAFLRALDAARRGRS